MTRRALVASAPPVVKPIVIGAFTLHTTGMTVRGRPSFEEYQGVGDFIKRAHQASGFWLADWLRYGTERTEWEEQLSQVQSITGLSHKRLENIRAVGAIEQSRRRDSVEFAIHEEVAGLEPQEQSEWLEKTEREGWDRRELRLNIRASRRRKVIEGQAVLEGLFRVIYADPAWLYSDSGPTVDGSLGKAERHYQGMTIEDLCKLPVAAHALPNAVLFCWVTAPILYETPGPREVIEAWGFTPKGQYIWDKVLGNPGHYNHVRHELLIIATRGSCQPDVPTPSPDSVQTVRRSGIHSQKPEEFRALIMQQYTTGPYLELFASERHEGWSCFGDDARLWAQQREAETVPA